MSECVVVYMSSVVSTQAISKKQRAILDFLDARKIDYKPIDMCANLSARGEMMEKIPEESKSVEGVKFLPPQVFNGADYCGDYENFFDAREMDLVYSFFKLEAPEGSSEYAHFHPPMPEPEPEEEVEEVEEVEEEEEDQLHGNEDTPMDAENADKSMGLFASLNKEKGDVKEEDCESEEVEFVEEDAAEVEEYVSDNEQ